MYLLLQLSKLQNAGSFAPQVMNPSNVEQIKIIPFWEQIGI